MLSASGSAECPWESGGSVARFLVADELPAGAREMSEVVVGGKAAGDDGDHARELPLVQVVACTLEDRLVGASSAKMHTRTGLRSSACATGCR